MKDFLLGLRFAFSYFSILPVKIKDGEDLSKKEVLNWTIFSFPLVGLIISLLAVAPAYFFHQKEFFIVLSAFLYLFLSGFIHLEAVIDVVDAIYARHSGKDAYKVIKEPTVGAIGVLWGVSFLILKVVGISFLLYHDRYFEFIMIAVFSRVLVLFLLYFCEFKSSFGSSLKSSLKVWVLVFYGVLFVFYLPFLIVGFIMIKVLKSKLGFLNGDTLGFVLESMELVMIGVLIGIS